MTMLVGSLFLETEICREESAETPQETHGKKYQTQSDLQHL